MQSCYFELKVAEMAEVLSANRVKTSRKQLGQHVNLFALQLHPSSIIRLLSNTIKGNSGHFLLQCPLTQVGYKSVDA